MGKILTMEEAVGRRKGVRRENRVKRRRRRKRRKLTVIFLNKSLRKRRRRIQSQLKGEENLKVGKKVPHHLPRRTLLNLPCLQPNKFVNNGGSMMLISSTMMLIIRTSQLSSFFNKLSGLESRLKTPRFQCQS